MVEFKPDLRGGTDIAALAGSVIAVSVSLFAGEAAYAPLSLAISASLFLVIFGYVWRTKRRLAQSFAVASAVGLIFLPACGYIYESVQLFYYKNDDEIFYCLGSRYNFVDNKKSRVCQGVLLFDWVLISTYVFFFDWLCQRRWSEQTDNTARIMANFSGVSPNKDPEPASGAHEGGEGPNC